MIFYMESHILKVGRSKSLIFEEHMIDPSGLSRVPQLQAAFDRY